MKALRRLISQSLRPRILHLFSLLYLTSIVGAKEGIVQSRDQPQNFLPPRNQTEEIFLEASEILLSLLLKTQL